MSKSVLNPILDRMPNHLDLIKSERLRIDKLVELSHLITADHPELSQLEANGGLDTFFDDPAPTTAAEILFNAVSKGPAGGFRWSIRRKIILDFLIALTDNDYRIVSKEERDLEDCEINANMLLLASGKFEPCTLYKDNIYRFGVREIKEKPSRGIDGWCDNFGPSQHLPIEE